MHAEELLTTLAVRGVRLFPDGKGLVAKPASRLTDPDREAIRTHKAELLNLLQTLTKPTEPTFSPDAGELAAAKLRNTVIGDVWLVADPDALAEHPDIIRAGLPVFWFDEVERLRGKTLAELQAIGMVKATFPTSRVLQ